MNKRKRIDDELFRKNKIRAARRDGYMCVICGSRATDVHHIVFRSQLGTSELSNLACLCRRCHAAAHGPYAKLIRSRLKEIINEKRNKSSY